MLKMNKNIRQHSMQTAHQNSNPSPFFLFIANRKFQNLAYLWFIYAKINLLIIKIPMMK